MSNKQIIDDAITDAGTISKVTEGDTDVQVTSRTGKKIWTLSTLSRMIEQGFYRMFSTTALLMAYRPEYSPFAAKALDTKKVYVWESDAWVDTGLSELDLANYNSEKSIYNEIKQSNAHSEFFDYDGFLMLDKDGSIIIDVGSDGLVNNCPVQSYQIPFLSYFDQDRTYIVDSEFNFNHGNLPDNIDSPEMYVKKLELDCLSVFIRGEKSNYIEYEIKHIVIPYNPAPSDPANSQANSDHWRVVAAYETNSSFERLWGGKQIVGDAWECAIREKNLADYMGTYHGDDVITECYFLINGKQYSQDDLFETEINDFQIYQKGHLYRQNSQLKMCEYTRYHQFSKDGLNLKQWFSWLQPATLVESLITMFPIRRNIDYSTVTGPLVSDESARFYSENLLIEDISRGGFEIKYSPFNPSDHIDITGKTSGIFARLTMIETPEIPTATVHMANPQSTNKVYYNATGAGVEHRVSIGDKWFNSSLYQITTLN